MWHTFSKAVSSAAMSVGTYFLDLAQFILKIASTFLKGLAVIVLVGILSPISYVFALNFAWSDVKSMSRSKLVTSSYTWLALVPAVAYFLQALESPITLPYFEQPLELHLGLPFSWRLFYVGSVCFSLGTLMYSLLCPPLIRNYSGFEEYSDEGRGGHYITMQMVYIHYGHPYMPQIFHIGKAWRGVAKEFILKFTEYSIFPIHASLLGDVVPKAIDPGKLLLTAFDYDEAVAVVRDQKKDTEDIYRFEFRLRPDSHAGAFWHVREASETLYAPIRWLIWRLFGVGVLLYLIVLVQGAWYVLKISLSDEAYASLIEHTPWL